MHNGPVKEAGHNNCWKQRFSEALTASCPPATTSGKARERQVLLCTVLHQSIVMARRGQPAICLCWSDAWLRNEMTSFGAADSKIYAKSLK